MKRLFDIDRALNGEPVRLRNGRKAYIYCVIPNEFTDGSELTLIGAILNINGSIYNNTALWTREGNHYINGIPHDSDIMEMWQ